MSVPTVFHFKGSRLAAWCLRRAGWTLHHRGFPSLQGVAIVYPHTSNWDFPVMLLAKWAIGVPVRFWGKDSLFRVPLFGRWLRSLGGVPVDRRSPHGAVATMVDLMGAARESHQVCWLALSPEGTRSFTPGWRSGFYRVALEAQVPVAVIGLDWPRRTIDVSRFVHLQGSQDADYGMLAAELRGVSGRHPRQASPVRPLGPPAQTVKETP